MTESIDPQRMTVSEARVILQQVREQGGEPFERLKAKCRWEHMTLLAVIQNWGDPRKWST